MTFRFVEVDVGIWRAFLERVETHTFFQTPEYYRIWLEHHAPSAHLRIFHGRDKDSGAAVLIPTIAMPSSRYFGLTGLIAAPESGYGFLAEAGATRVGEAWAPGFVRAMYRRTIDALTLTVDPMIDVDPAALRAAGFDVTVHEAYVAELPDSAEAWTASLDKRVRRALRRCADEGLETRAYGIEGLDRFEAIYRRSLADAQRGGGYSRAFLAALLGSTEALRPRLYLTFVGDRCVAGGLFLPGKKQGFAWIGAMDHAEPPAGANLSRHARVIADLIAEGARFYNLGAAPDLPGVAAFKIQLGARPRPYLQVRWRNRLIAAVRRWTGRS